MEADSKCATTRQRGSAGAAGARLTGLRLVCVPTEGHLPERAGLRIGFVRNFALHFAPFTGVANI